MASLTMTASFLTSTTMSTGRSRRGGMIVKASNSSEGEKLNMVAVKKNDGTSSNGRRELVFAAAAAVVYSITNGAMADEPKRGTPDAKKKYGPVCVTMPTARICHN